jgi:N-acetylneuraminate synthase
VETIRKSGCIAMSTPFDEKSVDLCVEFELPIIKVASADGNDWLLLEKIAKTKKPVIVSTGGVSLKDLDDLVLFFESRNIPLALNHCVAAYPTEDHEMELHQIDYLKRRYSSHPIGISTHEYHDWSSSMYISYAKGVRLFERHIDINSDGFTVAPYSSLPVQVDVWFKAFHKAREMCGTSENQRRIPLERETKYLDSYVRGAYARHDLQVGQFLTEDDIYLAIPLQKGQLSTRELMLGRYGHKLVKPCFQDQPVTIDMVDTPYSSDDLNQQILNRGL